MLVESELSRDTWTPPERRRETVAEWSYRWLGSRTRLAERTVELYRWLLDRHILPVLGDIALGDLSGDDVLEVDRLATAMPEHMQVVVLLAAWCHLRRGEILGLQRLDVDLEHEVLTIERTRTPTMRSGVVVGARRPR